MIDKKYLIMGGVGIAGVGLYLFSRKNTSQSDSADATQSIGQPAMMYMPSASSLGSGNYDPTMAGYSSSIPSNNPETASLSDVVSSTVKTDTLGQLAKYLTGGGTATLNDNSITIDNPTVTNNRALVQDFYGEIGRIDKGDAGGVAYWSGKLNSGESPDQVHQEFLSSAATFKNDAVYGHNAAIAQQKLDEIAGKKPATQNV